MTNTILAIDASSEACTVALHRHEQTHSLFEMAPRVHTQRILPMVEQLLKEQQVSLNDIDLFVYGRGPGAFTGIRIAAAFTQGLALGVDKPVLGVSTLYSLAAQSNAQQVLSMIDARMGELYAARWRLIDGQYQLIEDEFLTQPEALIIQPEDAAIIGNGITLLSPEQLKNKTLMPDAQPHAQYLISAALTRLQDAKPIEFDESLPRYLRDNVTY